LRIYQSRTGLSLPDLAARMGYAHRTLIQFVSGARYGDAEGESTAEAVRRFLGENSPPAPEPPPGKLYPAQNLRVCDEMIRYCLGGRWGVLYGPAGGGKSFNFECRAAQAFERTIEPAIVYIYASPEDKPARAPEAHGGGPGRALCLLCGYPARTYFVGASATQGPRGPDSR